MSIAGLPDWLGRPFAVLLIDLLLAGDNAVVIGLVCRPLPPRSRRTVLVCGMLGAVVARVVLAGIAGSVLGVPALKLAGGCLLALLALNLAQPEAHAVPASAAVDTQGSVGAAVVLVILADVLMSLDNVLALAAVAGDSLLYLAFGLLLSVSIVMFASALVARLMARLPDLARLGASLLGWIAGQMAVSDVLVRDWVASQAPALPLLVPALVAAYVYLTGRPAAPLHLPVPQPTIEPPPVVPAERVETLPAMFTPVAAEGAEAHEEEGQDTSERMIMIVFLALFGVAGVFLGVLVIVGDGLIR